MGNRLAFARIAGKVVATADGKAESRKKLMIAVRAACRRLGLDDDARREIQVGLTGKASMTEMDMADLGKVLDSLNRDWKGPQGHRAHIGKIRALWWTLYWIGAIDEPKDRAIDAFVRRQTGVSALRFLDHRGSHAVVEALKSWAGREGVEWPKAPGELGDRQAVLDTLWRRLRETGFVSTFTAGAYVSAALEIPPPEQRAWTAHELDAAIRLLGKRLRRELGKAVTA